MSGESFVEFRCLISGADRKIRHGVGGNASSGEGLGILKDVGCASRQQDDMTFLDFLSEHESIGLSRIFIKI